MQAIGRAQAIPDSLRSGIRGAERLAAHFHHGYRRAAHVSNDLYGWKSASERPRSELLRTLDREVGGRYACRRHGRFQRGVLDFQRHTDDRSAPFDRALYQNGLQYDEVRSD